MRINEFSSFNIIITEQCYNLIYFLSGGEWDYVIFSLVRSLPEYRIEPEPTLGWCKENLGFITDHHQINVALTRARKGLFVIGTNIINIIFIIHVIIEFVVQLMFRSISGNQNLMACEKDFLEEMLAHFEKNNCIVDASNFLPKSSGKSKTRVT